jgi:hypothetical protein
MYIERPKLHPGCYVTNNMVTNMCETCHDCFTDCHNQIIEFGYGMGNDNVVKCDCYNGPMKDNGEPDSIDIIYCSL